MCQLHISLTRAAQIYLELHFYVELHTKKSPEVRGKEWGGRKGGEGMEGKGRGREVREGEEGEEYRHFLEYILSTRLRHWLTPSTSASRNRTAYNRVSAVNRRLSRGRFY